MTAGLIVVGVVLVLGTGIGLWHRRVDGRLRPARATAAADRPASATAAQPASATAAQPAPARMAQPVEAERLEPELLAALGVTPAPATLLQFSSAFCAPCRAVRRVSSEVAAMVPGVRHVEVDAESHLDAVRALRIWRTPTLLLLDADGRVGKRATGVPSKPQLIAALGDVLPGGD
jgi:thiol-disulfide isomerase/thioredoxin